jgi:hypothetical protein
MTSSQHPESDREGDARTADAESTTGATAGGRASGDTDTEGRPESYEAGVFDQGHPIAEPGEGVFDQGHPEPEAQHGQGVFQQGHPEHEHRHGQGVYEQGHSDTDDPEQDVPDDTDRVGH